MNQTYLCLVCGNVQAPSLCVTPTVILKGIRLSSDVRSFRLVCCILLLKKKALIRKMLLPFSALFVLLLFTVCCSLLLFVRDNNDSNLESLIMVFRGFVLCAPWQAREKGEEWANGLFLKSMTLDWSVRFWLNAARFSPGTDATLVHQ